MNYFLYIFGLVSLLVANKRSGWFVTHEYCMYSMYAAVKLPADMRVRVYVHIKREATVQGFCLFVVQNKVIIVGIYLFPF